MYTSAGYLWVNCRVAFSWLYPLSNLVIGRSAQCDPGETNDSTRKVSQALMFVCVRCACPVCRVKCCDPTRKVGFLGYSVVQSTSVVRCHLCGLLHICSSSSCCSSTIMIMILVATAAMYHDSSTQAATSCYYY